MSTPVLGKINCFHNSLQHFTRFGAAAICRKSMPSVKLNAFVAGHLKGSPMAAHRENYEKKAAHEKEKNGTKDKDSRRPPAEEDQLIFVRDAATGAIIRIERVDASGVRTALKKSEAIALAGKGNLLEIEAALDDAFEAGISSVFSGTTPDDDNDDESEEEMEIRRFLLNDIVGRSLRRRLQRKLVQRLILARALPH